MKSYRVVLVIDFQVTTKPFSLFCLVIGFHPFDLTFLTSFYGIAATKFLKNPIPIAVRAHSPGFSGAIRKDCLGVHLISDALPFRCALLSGKNAIAAAIDYANCFSGPHAAVVHVYDEAGKLIEVHRHTGTFSVKSPSPLPLLQSFPTEVVKERAKRQLNRLAQALTYGIPMTWLVE